MKNLLTNKKNNNIKYIDIPVLPLKDIVIYPNIIVPLFIGREKSIKSLEKSINKDKKIMLLTQKDSSIDFPKIEDLFKIGTFSNIIQIFKLNDNTVKILVEGISRANVIRFEDNDNYITADIECINTTKIIDINKDAYIKTLINQLNIYTKLNKKNYIEILNLINNEYDLIKLIDNITLNLPIKLEHKQKILEINNIEDRAEFLIKLIEYEIELLQIEKKIHMKVKKQMEKNQKEYYLNEQIKVIQKELNNINNINDENTLIEKKMKLNKIPKYVKYKIENELKKLKTISYMSAESSVIRNYIECILSLPWNKRSRLKKSLIFAKNILDKNHYGLYKIKEYILEYLAVQTRTNKIKGSILCLIGPPGVGKTSLCKSIAKSTGRKYIKISLGGIKDEAEIRGHRRTYIGSMPGKIIQKISRIGVKNPLFLLDEIDKMSFDIRGDPSSALLEVLDSEQNSFFNDHYLEIDYDLSEVMFIATANSISKIPIPLLDRMEILILNGYSEEEKMNIAINHILPKQIKLNALKNNEIFFNKSSILSIIRFYTRESGVRNLEREISKICRKSLKLLITNNKLNSINICKKNLEKFIGIKKYNLNEIDNSYKIGQVTGLAWTEYGGDLLIIEVICVSGKGKLIYTGSLGDVMRESIYASLTLVKNISKRFNIKEDFYINHDIHVHIPEGSIPKDGPSAGVAICLSLISCLTKIPIKSNISMTGEITLNGNILPIGGLKEKILAAKRGKIKTILIPKNNLKELKDININYSEIEIIGINNINEAISILIESYNKNNNYV